MDKTFGPEDLDLILEVLFMNDTLALAAHATKVIEGAASYPIFSLDDAKTAFSANADTTNRLNLGRCVISWHHVEQYFGKARFPIRDRTDLLSALVIAAETERFDMLNAIAERQARARR